MGVSSGFFASFAFDFSGFFAAFAGSGASVIEGCVTVGVSEVGVAVGVEFPVGSGVGVEMTAGTGLAFGLDQGWNHATARPTTTTTIAPTTSADVENEDRGSSRFARSWSNPASSILRGVRALSSGFFALSLPEGTPTGCPAVLGSVRGPATGEFTIIVAPKDGPAFALLEAALAEFLKVARRSGDVQINSESPACSFPPVVSAGT